MCYNAISWEFVDREQTEDQMGKPFNTELQYLSKTIEYSETIDICAFQQYIYSQISSPFLVVGSGGSLAVAQTFALVINHLGGFAQAVTPYELMGFSRGIHKDNIVFFSASGGNPDIINAYVFCKQMEAKSSFIVCLSENSKLIEVAQRKYNEKNYIELSLPNGHDGFLAVNSTVCAVMMLKKLIEPSDTLHYIMPDLPDDAIKCLNADSIVALGGRWTFPVISDFESKCTEAGLIKVMPADLRNFAHGRHHWIAKNPDTSVICFATKDEYELAKKTVEILPKTVSSCVLLTNQDGISATLDLLFYVFVLVQRLGELKGIDPGKPGVPRFGSQLYRINYRLSAEAKANGALDSNILKRMAKRKAFVLHNEDIAIIENAAKDYLEKLSRAYFTGIVLDYDNTVVFNNNTDDDAYRSCIDSICSFLTQGIGVCFATGRGKSIRDQLLQVIPSDYVDNIYIAYYNGAIILPLDHELLHTSDCINPLLQIIYNYIIKSLPESQQFASLRNDCLTYEGNRDELEQIYSLIGSELLRGGFAGVKLLRSDHSIDIIPSQVSKKNAEIFMRDKTGGDILCIGDSGDEFGNDYELLNTSFSLSVDHVSMSLANCWNISSLGISGPTAVKEYFDKLLVQKKGLHFKKSYLRYKL